MQIRIIKSGMAAMNEHKVKTVYNLRPITTLIEHNFTCYIVALPNRILQLSNKVWKATRILKLD